MRTPVFLVIASLALLPRALPAQQDVSRFTARDVFELEWAADPQISPDGRRVVYVRRAFDIMKDRARSSLWLLNADGSDHRALASGEANYHSPRWSPDGTRLLYASTAGGSSDLYVRWMDSGNEAKLSHLTESPGAPAWSPDGKWIAFTMFVPESSPSIAQMPAMPDGADWGPPIKFTDRVTYRTDEDGYLKQGHTHLFLLPADGGTPRQLTAGAYDDGAPQWAPDGRAILFSANRRDSADFQPLNSEIYEVSLADDSVRALTDRFGPDGEPAVSPDGRLVAYTGFDDRYQGYQVTHLYLMNRDGSGKRIVTGGFDRDIASPVWSRDGKGLFVLYDEEGDTKLGFVTLEGAVRALTEKVGGLSIDRPYGGGSFTVARDGRFAFTHTAPDHLADVATARERESVQRLTRLNDDVFAGKRLGTTEEFWYQSSFDQRRIQGWIVKPPDFDPARKYPLILEIHGGPYANYGSRFGADPQLYAAAGYVVLFVNPRGSTSYGEAFGNLIHQDYPDHDYDDLMSGVDAVIAKGYVDQSNLFVTGGSGGGVLTAWIVGHTNRFRAAVVAKPVINWSSFVLTADGPTFFYRYWAPGLPWEHPDFYAQRSPITYMGNVQTPTMLVTGEVDYRTPSEEAEQFYTALKLRKVPAAMVRIPDASHDIAARPSNLIAKVAYILGWFAKYRGATP